MLSLFQQSYGTTRKIKVNHCKNVCTSCGSRHRAVVRALNQCGPGSIPAHMWAAFVPGSRIAPMVFLRALRFCSFQQFQFDQNGDLSKADVASSQNIVIL